MTQAIRDAGFTPVPEQVGLTLTGVLESRSGRYVLVLDRMQKSKDVVCVPASGGEASEAALRAGVGRTVQIEGRWRFDGDSLLVERITIQPGS